MRNSGRVIAMRLALALGCGMGPRAANAAAIFENVVITSGPVLQIDPSTRSAGMGGASSAVFWGNDPNHWANPALLGSMTGARFEGGEMSALPEIFPELKFRTRGTTLGYGGIGVALGGQPFGGFSELRSTHDTSPSDSLALGLTLSAPEEYVHSWGAGVSLARGLESLARWRGHDAPSITRRSDLEFGINHKSVTDDGLDRAHSPRTTAYDWGLLAHTSLPLRQVLGGHPGSVDLAYAFSIANANDATLFSIPCARQRRNGVALRASMDVPAAISRRMPSWLAAGIPSLVSVGFAYDANHVKAGSSPRRGYNLNASGIELAVAGILFGRVGRTNNSLGTGTTNRTWGIGAALPIGRWGALHYDYANVDREFGGRLTPESWSVEVNPIAIATDMR